MLSLDYSGWNDVSLGLEINGVHTEAHDPQLAVDVNDLGYVARLHHSALNERIIQQARIFKLASEGAYIGRWDLSLDWSDEWTFTCSVITYKVRNDASLFRALRNHDSVNVTARYSF